MNVRLTQLEVLRSTFFSDPFDIPDDAQIVHVEWDREVVVVSIVQPWHSDEYLAQLAAEAAQRDGQVAESEGGLADA